MYSNYEPCLLLHPAGCERAEHRRLYALMAVGLAMVFGILRLINFAHGDMMMVAAYIAAFALFAQLPLLPTLVLTIGGTVALGLLIERVAYRPIRARRR